MHCSSPLPILVVLSAAAEFDSTDPQPFFPLGGVSSTRSLTLGLLLPKLNLEQLTPCGDGNVLLLFPLLGGGAIDPSILSTIKILRHQPAVARLSD